MIEKKIMRNQHTLSANSANAWDKIKLNIGRIFSYLYLIFSFGMLDAWLRVVTREIKLYHILELAPNLFTVLWAIVLVSVLTWIPSRFIGRIVYGIVYYAYMIYTIVQYGAYLTIGSFLYVSDFIYAGEGADYADWVMGFITPSFALQVVLLVLIGVIGIAVLPKQHTTVKGTLIRLVVIVLAASSMTQVPRLYGELGDTVQWDDFSNPAFEYERFANANFDMQLTGMYQYLARDVEIQIQRTFEDNTEDIAMIDAFFDEKEEHAENEMTGIFEGKNVIVVMMESIDDWVITEEDTPTMYQMMNQGINFTNMYTPKYSSGYTFNTEFAFNTSVYPYSNGNVAYALGRHNFDYAIANIFKNAGYSVNSYHVGTPDYYNRGQMHKAFGYSAYDSYQSYDSEDCPVSIENDCFLVENDALYQELVGKDAPFFSFVITYSAHLPYTDNNHLAQEALRLYPQYDVQEDREAAILRAKAKMTDDMFAGLLERLEEDDLLENTVIVAYADHYSYGITDEDLLQRLTEEAGNSILENTPAFVYYAGYEQPIAVDKVMQTTDLGPTVINLFGLDVPENVMGHDVFDENYVGFAIFRNNTWITNTTYMKNGKVEYNNGMTDEEIAEMSAYVKEVYQVNDAILDTDYYQYKKNP